MGRIFVLIIFLFICIVSSSGANDSRFIENKLREKWLYPHEKSALVSKGDDVWQKLIDEKIILYKLGRLQILKDEKFFSVVRSYPDYEIKGLKITYCKLDIWVHDFKFHEGSQKIRVNFKVLNQNPWLKLPLFEQGRKICSPPSQTVLVIKKGNQFKIE